jgi:hypothetical protein
MLMLLAKVKTVREKRGFTGEDGIKRIEMDCTATIKSAVRSTSKMPPGLKGKSVRLGRTCFEAFKTKPGDLLVLDADESVAAVRKYVKTRSEKRPELEFGEKCVGKGDYDSDGLVEYSIENVFLRSIISPSYGARVLELWNLGTGRNELYGAQVYEDKGYVELGGIEESVTPIGKPPDAWNQAYKKKSVSGCDASFEADFKKMEGLKHVKSFTVLADAPLLCQTSTFEFKPKASGKKKKGKKIDLTYVPMVFFGIGGETDCTNLFFVPTREQLARIRYNTPPWVTRWGGGIWDWKKMWHAVKPGFVLLANERTNECMAIFADPKELNYAWVGRDRRTPRVFLSHNPKKLKPKEKAQYSIAVAVGRGYDVTKNSLLMVSRGKKGKTGIPCAIIYRSLLKGGAPKAALTFDGEKKTVRLRRLSINGVGNIYYSSMLLGSDPEEVRVEIETANEKLTARGARNEAAL